MFYQGYDSVVQVTQPQGFTTVRENEQMVIAMKATFNYVQIVPVSIHLEFCRQFPLHQPCGILEYTIQYPHTYRETVSKDKTFKLTVSCIHNEELSRVFHDTNY